MKKIHVHNLPCSLLWDHMEYLGPLKRDTKNIYHKYILHTYEGPKHILAAFNTQKEDILYGKPLI